MLVVDSVWTEAMKMVQQCTYVHTYMQISSALWCHLPLPLPFPSRQPQMSSLWESYDYPHLSFRRKWDRIKEYMIRNNIPKEVSGRVYFMGVCALVVCMRRNNLLWFDSALMFFCTRVLCLWMQLQKRVQAWYSYASSQQVIFGMYM